MDHVELLRTCVFGLLLPDILPNHCFVQTHSGNIVPAAPEAFPGEIPLSRREVSCDLNRSLAFDEADHTRHRKLGWDAHAHVDVIRT